MILLNNGLSDQEKEKVKNPFSHQYQQKPFDFGEAGKHVADFISRNEKTFLVYRVGSSLNDSSGYEE